MWRVYQASNLRPFNNKQLIAVSAIVGRSRGGRRIEGGYDNSETICGVSTPKTFLNTHIRQLSEVSGQSYKGNKMMIDCLDRGDGRLP
jgi:hypothetical protein